MNVHGTDGIWRRFRLAKKIDSSDHTKIFVKCEFSISCLTFLGEGEKNIGKTVISNYTKEWYSYADHILVVLEKSSSWSIIKDHMATVLKQENMTRLTAEGIWGKTN